MSLLVYFIGLVCLLANGGRCELTWDNVYNRLSLRMEDIVFDIKSKENSIMKQVQDVISMVTATNEKLASFEKRLSEMADCSAKSVVVEERSLNIETYVKEVAKAEVGRLTHLLRRGLEQEKAATMTRFESLRKNQEQIMSRTANMDTRLNETGVNMSNLEHEVIGTINNTSIVFGRVNSLETTQVAMKGTEEKTRALIAVIENEVKSTQRNTISLQSQVQTLVTTQRDLQSKTRTIEAQVNTTRAHIYRLQRFNEFSGHGKDCMELRKLNRASGIYPVKPEGMTRHIEVYCDMATDEGGWTVFQRRVDGSVDFYQNFSSYENGFGDVHGEHWLGLKYIYAMTSNARTELRIDLMAADGSTAYEVFPNFRLSATPDFTLHIDKGHGTAGDSEGLSFNNGSFFATYDRQSCFCTINDRGGWWYTGCAYANLNGEYITPGTTSVYNGGEGVLRIETLKVLQV